MPEQGFSMALYFPYKDRILDSVHIRENTDQRKPVFWCVLRTEYMKDRDSSVGRKTL